MHISVACSFPPVPSECYSAVDSRIFLPLKIYCQGLEKKWSYLRETFSVCVGGGCLRNGLEPLPGSAKDGFCNLLGLQWDFLEGGTVPERNCHF